MQINTNGKRNITLDFDAPKKFKLKKDGAEIPYIRTGKNSFRLGRNIDGVLDLEEVIEQPRIVKPMQLQAQQMALVNPNDVLMINQAAQQLEIEQNLLSETQKRAEQTQAFLDVQQQRINESVLSVQGLENDNAQRITATENGIFNLAGNLATAEQNLVDGIDVVNNELQEHKTAENPHGITKETIGLNKVDNTSDLDKPISKAVQSALDEKADKDEIQAIRDELGEYREKNDRFTNALSNYTGGLAGNQLPDGGLEGQILAKRSDMSGDAEWVDSSASINVDAELSLTSKNPVQNKVITLAVNNISDEITDISNKIESIGSKIPAQASSSNQLADKDFVNSSIATNTATFRGTFNSVAELESYSGEKDNNDYAFVTGTDQTGNTYYDRYKYDGFSWVYEYRLNNSSFTSAQWASINSGATTQSINQISTNTASINLLQTSKQDVISDLATIRSGAALGATAVQPSDLATVATSGNYNDLSNKPTIPTATSDLTNDSGYITSSALTPYVLSEDLATVATSGSYNDLTNQPTIPTVNNPTITFTQGGTTKGTITLNQSSNQTVEFDAGSGSSYTAGTGINITNNVISVEGVKDQNNTTSAIKTWTGTLAQYNAIATKDSNTLYNITDDNTAVAYQAYTKSEVDNLISAIYPIGSIYIGTQSTCPLATLISGSTWVKVSEGRVLQGSDLSHNAGTTIEAGLPDIQGNIRINEFGWNPIGAFTIDQRDTQNVQGTNSSSTVDWVKFKASAYNSIYGNSSTVQPPAFVVNIWQRTA